MAVSVRAIVEVMGFPKEHVDETLLKVLENLKKEEGLKITKEEIVPAEVMKEQMFSSFFIVELSCASMQRLHHFCFFYLPSSLELLDQNEVMMSANEFTSVMNDLLAALHQYNMTVSNLHAESEVLRMKLAKHEDPEQKKKDM